MWASSERGISFLSEAKITMIMMTTLHPMRQPKITGYVKNIGGGKVMNF